MEKEYDFNRIGKRMPYSMPEGFFDMVQHNVLAEVVVEEAARKAKRKTMRMRVCGIVAAVAASVCLVVGVATTGGNATHEPRQQASMAKVDKAYDNLSAEEQAEIASTYENDVYLTMQ